MRISSLLSGGIRSAWPFPTAADAKEWDGFSSRVLVYGPLSLAAAFLVVTSPGLMPGAPWTKVHIGNLGTAVVVGLMYGVALVAGLRRRQYWDLVVAPVTLALSTLLVITVLMPVTQARHRGLLEQCKQNLGDVANALNIYGQDNEGEYPDRLDRLVRGERKFMLAIPTCPEAGQDTYSRGYRHAKGGGVPEVFTVYCRGLNHDACSIVADFPQYASTRGLINDPVWAPGAGSPERPPPPGTQPSIPNGQPLFNIQQPATGSMPPLATPPPGASPFLPGGAPVAPGGSPPPAR